MVFIWIFLFIIGLLNGVSYGYQCTMQFFEVTCTSIESSDISGDVSVTLNKPDIDSLNITNGHIPIISKAILKDFKQLQYLYIINSSVSDIKDDAFIESTDLKYLYLNNNSLREFNWKSLCLENSQIRQIDLSYNRLEDLGSFNVSLFPQLKLLNLANNFLAHLPLNILDLLKEEEEFYLISDNNPWNCSHSNWSQSLTDNLVKAFCVNRTFDYTPDSIFEPNSTPKEIFPTTTFSTQTTTQAQKTPFKRHLKTEDYEDDVSYIDTTTDTFVTTEAKAHDSRDTEGATVGVEQTHCMKCSFYFCLMWFFGGIWIGVIVGNVGKVKRLVCNRRLEYTDNSTQCEQSLSDQYMISGFRLDFNNQKRALLVPLPVSRTASDSRHKEKSKKTLL